MTTPIVPHQPGPFPVRTIRDDLVLPFSTRSAGVSGRLVRLGASVDTILNAHAYADPVSTALGEALLLAALLGSALKFEGQLILQTKSDGALGMLVADYMVPGHLRGYAGVDAKRLAALASTGVTPATLQALLLGAGTLAMTIDPGGDMDRYQGIVPLDGTTLTEAAHTYFRQSEQLPTLIRLAVARHFSGGVWQWRAGGLMIQQVARTGGLTIPASDEDRDASLEGEDDENWTRVKLLAATVEDHELTDPTLDPHRLLFRLFHEEGVTARPPTPLMAKCRCSRDRLLGYLKGFDASALADLRDENGQLTATCEFCSTVYTYGRDDGVG